MAEVTEDLRKAREAAHQYVRAVREMAEFLDRLDHVADPAVETEYATFLAREEAAREARQDALHDLGLVVRSLEEDAEA